MAENEEYYPRQYSLTAEELRRWCPQWVSAAFLCIWVHDIVVYMQQSDALTILKMGHSVFLTGEAGTGKTHVLREYISYLKKHDITPAVTASTGIAATHIGGRTIHSWSGLGIKDAIGVDDLERMEQKKHLWDRYQETDVLIIDEVSMLSAEFISMLDRVARHMRRNEEPFGGMQVVLSGDFFQLPPVVKNGSEICYAFESYSWQECNPVVCYLTQQYRHGDEQFLSLLSAIRNREVDDDVRDILKRRSEALPDDHEHLTRLFTHNVDVDDVNEKQLDALDGHASHYDVETSGRKRYVESLMRGCLAPEKLRLKEGAEVMFIKNDPAGKYVNGTRGTVVSTDGMAPTVMTRDGRKITATPESWRRENDGKKLAEIKQVPLRLAWAITVHKSQGMTLDEAAIDLSKSFVPGQGYVALSRVRSLDGLYLHGFNRTALSIEGKVADADDFFQKKSEVARKRLEKLSKEEKDQRYDAFIMQCGGSVEEIDIEEESSTTTRTPSHEKTHQLLKGGLTPDEIANERDLANSTIIGHIEKIADEGLSFDRDIFAPNDENLIDALNEAVDEHTFEKLSPIKHYLNDSGHDVSYDELRLIRVWYE